MHVFNDLIQGSAAVKRCAQIFNLLDQGRYYGAFWVVFE